MARTSQSEWSMIGTDVRIPAFGVVAKVAYLMLTVASMAGVGLILAGVARTGRLAGTGGFNTLPGLIFGIVMSLFFVVTMPFVMSRRAMVLGLAGFRWDGPQGRSFQLLWTEMVAARAIVVVQHPFIGVRRRKRRVLALDIWPIEPSFGGRHPEVDSFRDLPGAKGFYRITLGPAIGRKSVRLDDALRRYAGAPYRPIQLD